MPPTPDTGLPASFFRALAFNALDNIRGGAPREEVETYLAGILKDTFESGMSSTLVAVVSAIEAVKVPRAGMVLFKVPYLSEAAMVAFRRDVGTIAGMLEERLGFKPIMLCVPADTEAQVVDFADEAEETPAQTVLPFPGLAVVPDPTAEPVRRARPRFVAFDALKVRDLVIEELPDDAGTVTVLPLGSSTADGIARHDIRVVLDDDDLDLIPGFADSVRKALQTEANRLDAHLNVLVVLGKHPHAPADALMSDSDEWVGPQSAHFVLAPVRE